jgi:hypothetical protein
MRLIELPRERRDEAFAIPRRGQFCGRGANRVHAELLGGKINLWERCRLTSYPTPIEAPSPQGFTKLDESEQM